MLESAVFHRAIRWIFRRKFGDSRDTAVFCLASMARVPLKERKVSSRRRRAFEGSATRKKVFPSDDAHVRYQRSRKGTNPLPLTDLSLPPPSSSARRQWIRIRISHLRRVISSAPWGNWKVLIPRVPPRGRIRNKAARNRAAETRNDREERGTAVPGLEGRQKGEGRLPMYMKWKLVILFGRVVGEKQLEQGFQLQKHRPFLPNRITESKRESRN